MPVFTVRRVLQALFLTIVTMCLLNFSPFPPKGIKGMDEGGGVEIDDVDEADVIFANASRDAIEDSGILLKEDHMFRLKPGVENVIHDLHTVIYHQNEIQIWIAMRNNYKAAAAIANYFAAIANVTDDGVKKEVTNALVPFLANNSCPKWNLNYKEPVEYALCDCSDSAPTDWMVAVQDKESTHNCTLTNLHAEQLLLQSHVQLMHRCNSRFAWALITMLYVKHGTRAGLQYFRSGDFRLYFEGLTIERKHGTNKTAIAMDFLKDIDKHLHEGVAEGSYHRMDIIVTALNKMHTMHNESWLTRMQYSMSFQFTIRNPPSTPKPTLDELAEARRAHHKTTFIIIVVFFVGGLAAVIASALLWQTKLRKKWLQFRGKWVDEDEDEEVEMDTIQPAQNQAAPLTPGTSDDSGCENATLTPGSSRAVVEPEWSEPEPQARGRVMSWPVV